MMGQRRTDTSMGCPAVQRRELQENLKGYNERLSKVKSTLSTRPPPSQPHLTLYGRDYASKKKMTTEAAFADLKMIQAIARTMTRKTEVEERKGPVSLNSDARKREIRRVMQENHKLLDKIESVKPFCKSQTMVKEHNDRQRYVINASHTSRLSGDYDSDLARIKREDKYHFAASQQSIRLRRAAAERLQTTVGGSISLPALTSASSSEPLPPPGARIGAKKESAPSKGWTWAGEAAAAELRRADQHHAKPGRQREPTTASSVRPAEPRAAVTNPRPAVRFARPTPIQTEEDGQGDEERVSTPVQRARRKGAPTPSQPIKAPEVEKPREDFDEDDDLEVQPTPAEPRVEEPPAADPEEGEPTEPVAPGDAEERQDDVAPPDGDELSEAEPDEQDPVLVAEEPEPPVVAELDPRGTTPRSAVEQ